MNRKFLYRHPDVVIWYRDQSDPEGNRIRALRLNEYSIFLAMHFGVFYVGEPGDFSFSPKEGMPWQLGTSHHKNWDQAYPVSPLRFFQEHIQNTPKPLISPEEMAEFEAEQAADQNGSKPRAEARSRSEMRTPDPGQSAPAALPEKPEHFNESLAKDMARWIVDEKVANRLQLLQNGLKKFEEGTIAESERGTWLEEMRKHIGLIISFREKQNEPSLDESARIVIETVTYGDPAQAYDIAAPLTVIDIRLQFAQKAADLAAAKDALEIVETNSDIARVSEIVRLLSNYAKSPDSERSEFITNELLGKTHWFIQLSKFSVSTPATPVTRRSEVRVTAEEYISEPWKSITDKFKGVNSDPATSNRLQNLFKTLRKIHKDQETFERGYHRFAHGLELADLALLIAKNGRYSAADTLEILLAALLHDIDLTRKDWTESPKVINTVWMLLRGDEEAFKEYFLRADETVIKKLKRLHDSPKIRAQQQKILELLEALGFKKGQENFDRLILRIYVTDFRSPQNPNGATDDEINAKLSKLDPEFVKQLRLLKQLDIAVTYLRLSPEEALKRVSDLEIEQKVLIGTLIEHNPSFLRDFIERPINKEQPNLETLLNAFPPNVRGEYSRNFAAVKSYFEEKSNHRAELRSGNVKKPTALKEVLLGYIATVAISLVIGGTAALLKGPEPVEPSIPGQVETLLSGSGASKPMLEAEDPRYSHSQAKEKLKQAFEQYFDELPAKFKKDFGTPAPDILLKVHFGQPYMGKPEEMARRRIIKLNEIVEEIYKSLDQNVLPDYWRRQPDAIKKAFFVLDAFGWASTLEFLEKNNIRITVEPTGSVHGATTGSHGPYGTPPRIIISITMANDNPVKTASAIIHEAEHAKAFPTLRKFLWERFLGISDVWDLLADKLPDYERKPFAEQAEFYKKVLHIDVSLEDLSHVYLENRLIYIGISLAVWAGVLGGTWVGYKIVRLSIRWSGAQKSSSKNQPSRRAELRSDSIVQGAQVLLDASHQVDSRAELRNVVEAKKEWHDWLEAQGGFRGFYTRQIKVVETFQMLSFFKKAINLPQTQTTFEFDTNDQVETAAEVEQLLVEIQRQHPEVSLTEREQSDLLEAAKFFENIIKVVKEKRNLFIEKGKIELDPGGTKGSAVFELFIDALAQSQGRPPITDYSIEMNSLYEQYGRHLRRIHEIIGRVFDRMAPVIVDAEEQIPSESNFSIYTVREPWQETGGAKYLGLSQQSVTAGLTAQILFRDPNKLIDAFYLSVRYQIPLNRELEEAVRKNLARFAPTLRVRRQFLALLALEQDPSEALFSMRDLGVLKKLLPPFKTLNVLTEPTHQYPVDIHTLILVRFLWRLRSEEDGHLSLPRHVFEDLLKNNPELILPLTFAILFHDSAKSPSATRTGPGHAYVAAKEIVPKVLAQYPVSVKDKKLIEWLVLNHAKLKARADIVARDPAALKAQISEWVKTDPYMNPQVFTLLYLLTYADAFSVSDFKTQDIIQMNKMKPVDDFFSIMSEFLGTRKSEEDLNRIVDRFEAFRQRDDAEFLAGLYRNLEGSLSGSALQRWIREYGKEMGAEPLMADPSFLQQIPTHGPSLKDFFEGRFKPVFPVAYLRNMTVPSIASGVIFLAYLEFAKEKGASAMLVKFSRLSKDYESYLEILVGNNRDFRGLLAVLTGVFAALEINIQQAEIHTVDGVIVDRFIAYVMPPYDKQENLQRLVRSRIATFLKLEEEGAAIEEIFTRLDEMMQNAVLRRVGRKGPTRVTFRRHDTSEDLPGPAMEMEVQTPDRIGLLYTVSRLLAQRYGVSIHHFGVSTYYEGALDALIIYREDGQPIDTAMQRDIRRTVRELFSKKIITNREVSAVASQRYGARLPDQADNSQRAELRQDQLTDLGYVWTEVPGVRGKHALVPIAGRTQKPLPEKWSNLNLPINTQLSILPGDVNALKQKLLSYLLNTHSEFREPDPIESKARRKQLIDFLNEQKLWIYDDKGGEVDLEQTISLGNDQTFRPKVSKLDGIEWTVFQSTGSTGNPLDLYFFTLTQSESGEIIGHGTFTIRRSAIDPFPPNRIDRFMYYLNPNSNYRANMGALPVILANIYNLFDRRIAEVTTISGAGYEDLSGILHGSFRQAPELNHFQRMLGRGVFSFYVRSGFDPNVNGMDSGDAKENIIRAVNDVRKKRIAPDQQLLEINRILSAVPLVLKLPVVIDQNEGLVDRARSELRAGDQSLRTVLLGNKDSVTFSPEEMSGKTSIVVYYVPKRESSARFDEIEFQISWNWGDDFVTVKNSDQTVSQIYSGSTIKEYLNVEIKPDRLVLTRSIGSGPESGPMMVFTAGETAEKSQELMQAANRFREAMEIWKEMLHLKKQNTLLREKVRQALTIARDLIQGFNEKHLSDLPKRDRAQIESILRSMADFSETLELILQDIGMDEVKEELNRFGVLVSSTNTVESYLLPTGTDKNWVLTQMRDRKTAEKIIASNLNGTKRLELKYPSQILPHFLILDETQKPKLTSARLGFVKEINHPVVIRPFSGTTENDVHTELLIAQVLSVLGMAEFYGVIDLDDGQYGYATQPITISNTSVVQFDEASRSSLLEVRQRLTEAGLISAQGLRETVPGQYVETGFELSLKSPFDIIHDRAQFNQFVAEQANQPPADDSWRAELRPVKSPSAITGQVKSPVKAEPFYRAELPSAPTGLRTELRNNPTVADLKEVLLDLLEWSSPELRSSIGLLSARGFEENVKIDPHTGTISMNFVVNVAPLRMIGLKLEDLGKELEKEYPGYKSNVPEPMYDPEKPEKLIYQLILKKTTEDESLTQRAELRQPTLEEVAAVETAGRLGNQLAVVIGGVHQEPERLAVELSFASKVVGIKPEEVLRLAQNVLADRVNLVHQNQGPITQAIEKKLLELKTAGKPITEEVVSLEVQKVLGESGLDKSIAELPFESAEVKAALGRVLTLLNQEPQTVSSEQEIVKVKEAEVAAMSQASADIAKAILNAIVALDRTSVIAYRMTDDQLKTINPASRRSVFQDLARKSAVSVASNGHLIIRLDLPASAVRETSLRELGRNNKVQRIVFGSSAFFFNTGNQDALRNMDDQPSMWISPDRAGAETLLSKVYADGDQIDFNEESIAGELLIAALAHLALSKETNQFLKQLDNGNLQVQSREALQNLVLLLASMLDQEARQQALSAKAA